MMNFSIRAASIDDLNTLVSFILAEANEAEGQEKSPATVSKGIRTGLKNPTIAQYWVLENNQSSIVGSASVVKEWSDWHAGYYWWIQSMFIQPEYRGQGLMALLLDHIKVAAKVDEALELRLYVHQNNSRAIKAYNREGFSNSSYQIMTMDIK